MREKSYLIDSNIIIYHLNNDITATKFLLENFQVSAISRLTCIEVLSFGFSLEERGLVAEYLEQYKIIDTNRAISLQAIKNRRSKKIKLPDNIIASTAQVYELTLVTRNEKDFKSLNIDILNPFTT